MNELRDEDLDIGTKEIFISDELICLALEKTGGFLTAAAKMLGISYQTLKNRIKESMLITNSLESINERHIDIAEGKLLKLINEENLNAIIFFLKNKAKHRGYESKENNVNVNVGGVLVVPSGSSELEWEKVAITQQQQLLTGD